MILEDETYPEVIIVVPEYQYELKAWFYSIGILSVITILRAQISEILVLQLVPGLFLFYLFCAFLFILSTCNWMYRAMMYWDVPYKRGALAFGRIRRKITTRVSLFFLVLTLGLGFIWVIPISLDSFQTNEKATIIGAWSYGKVLFVENFLTIVLALLSQIPIVFIFPESFNEEDVAEIALIWREVSFLILLGSGLLTPTVDIETQLSFALSILILYGFLVEISVKRPFVKISLCQLLNN